MAQFGIELDFVYLKTLKQNTYAGRIKRMAQSEFGE